MILGMSVSAFTTLHVVISLIGIGTGLMFLGILLVGRQLPALTAAFLGSTILTTVTGFLFPFTTIKPPHIVGAISVVVLAVCLVALYGKQLAGRWHAVFVVTSILSLYLNAFVGVVQAFQKLAPLHELAPTGTTEPAFLAAHGLTLAFFVILGVVALRRFRPGAADVVTAGLQTAR